MEGGGGALSSKVSKLGEFCHCEDERSEDVAIAKSLDIDEITTQSPIARNDSDSHLERSERSQSNEILRLPTHSQKTDTLTFTSSARAPQNDNNRHAEFISASQTHPNLPLKREGTVRHPELADCELRTELDCKMAKPLQTSSVDPLNASNQAVSGSQNETVFSRFTYHFSRKRIAFTLAEVLITLGIIGVVAAITIPSMIEKIEKHRNLTALKRAYSDLSQYLKSFDYENDCSGELLNCTYTPPEGIPLFVIDFSKYLVEKQNFKLVTGANNMCWRIPVQPAGTILPDLPYFPSCPINENQSQFFLISPTGNYAYYITQYMYDNFYTNPDNKGVFRARIAIFTDGRRFKPCKLNCTEQEISKASKLGKNIFKAFITDKEYIVPQGGCSRNSYYCIPLTTDNCSKDTNNYEACMQKIIEDGWRMNY